MILDTFWKLKSYWNLSHNPSKIQLIFASILASKILPKLLPKPSQNPSKIHQKINQKINLISMSFLIEFRAPLGLHFRLKIH